MPEEIGETPAPSVGGIIGRIRAESPKLPDALQRIAESILSDPASAALATIIDLAERSGTSTATVTRFCRMFGFRGYAALRVALATETGRAEQARWDLDIGREILPADPLDRVLSMVASADSRAIQETAAQLDVRTLDQVISAIVQARRVEVFGIASSANAAQELALRLQRIGVLCWARSEVHTALTNAAILRPGDVAIGLSHSGLTREVIEVIAEAGGHGATTVAVIGSPRTPLAEVADHLLITASHETTFRPEALAALHAQLLVLDLIYIGVAQRTYDASVAAFEETARAVTGHRLPDKASSSASRRPRRPTGKRPKTTVEAPDRTEET
ncbi:MurR/RpiR family transcriptional regulator [Microtetraspora sp. NBRC 16547]|uniref:MurR/RpiR family transcriptional regulator n=1 Tax=Microtetraspora sp. NBRC 16547 TaxID=3030993 RepID=UPI0024A5BCF1|nr:MurR/RpiR family transcriptional regulator [Microtetraspora sp. NBRC 16547]GLX02328.1 RpiR family transcriptional regulator [Microtetraspora sp. NBRC 16547]